MKMNTLLYLNYTENIKAAPDAHLSSSETHLLVTLLSEEDQYDYDQLLKTTLSDNILHTLHQVTFPSTF